MFATLPDTVEERLAEVPARPRFEAPSCCWFVGMMEAMGGGGGPFDQRE